MEARTFQSNELMICLSKNLKDEYVNMFAYGSDLPLQDYNDSIPDDDVLIRSIAKRDLIKERLENNKTFYYMDSGYFGNYPCRLNPRGDKLYHRIVKNNLQHTDIVDRPDDRWLALKQEIKPWRQRGEHILLVVPSEKPCKFYGIDHESWIEETVDNIKKHTDRPIKIRHKQQRRERLASTIFEDLKNAYALVTFNSIAAVEAVQYGIPAFTQTPTAADPVCDKDLSKIESPTLYSDKERYRWACHLAYGQFHIKEFKNGTAYKLLNENS